MAYTYQQYSEAFGEAAAENGLSIILQDSFSVIPASAGYTLDTMLGLDGLLNPTEEIESQRYNHFRGPFGLLLGGIPAVVGFGLGFILKWLLRGPEQLGWLLDRGITLLSKRLLNYRFNGNSFNPEFFDEWMLGNVILKYVAILFYSLPLRQPLNPRMRGPFGFILGYGPAFATVVVTGIASIATSIIKYVVDNVSDVVRFVTGGIISRLKFVFRFGRKPQIGPAPGDNDSSDTTSRLEEDAPVLQGNPTPNNAVPTPEPAQTNDGANGKRRLLRPKKVTSEVEEEKKAEQDPLLKEAIEKNINLFTALGITPEQANDTKAINKAFRAASLLYHPDKQRGKTDDVKTIAAERWHDIQLASGILLDSNKNEVYMNYYRSKNPTFFSSARPASPQPASTTSPVAANDIDPTATQNRTSKLMRTKLT